MLREKPHHEADRLFHPTPQGRVFFIYFYLIQIIVTGLITDAAVTLVCVISQNRNPGFSSSLSSTPQPTNEAKRNRNLTSREQDPQRGKSRGLWLLYVALGTYNLRSVFTAQYPVLSGL